MVDYYPSTVAGFDGLGHVTVRVRNPSGVQDTAMISMIGIKLRAGIHRPKSRSARTKRYGSVRGSLTERFGPIREIRVDS